MPQPQRSNPFKNIRALHTGVPEELPAPDIRPDEDPSISESVDSPRQIDGQTEVRLSGRKPGRSNKPGYQKLTVYVPDALYRTLKVQAATDARDLYAIAEEAFEDWIQKRKS